MTLEQFLDILACTADQEWFITPEGWLRTFVEGAEPIGNELPWHWVVTAVCRLLGREYGMHDWRRAGAFLGLSERDLDALKGADQNNPVHAELRKEIERRLGLAERAEVLDRIEAQDAKVQAAMEDLKAPWQREEGKEIEQWTEYLRKGETKP
jgi:hypothetical protein